MGSVTYMTYRASTRLINPTQATASRASKDVALCLLPPLEVVGSDTDLLLDQTPDYWTCIPWRWSETATAPSICSASSFDTQRLLPASWTMEGRRVKSRLSAIRDMQAVLLALDQRLISKQYIHVSRTGRGCRAHRLHWPAGRAVSGRQHRLQLIHSFNPPRCSRHPHVTA